MRHTARPLATASLLFLLAAGSAAHAQQPQPTPTPGARPPMEAAGAAPVPGAAGATGPAGATAAPRAPGARGTPDAPPPRGARPEPLARGAAAPVASGAVQRLLVNASGDVDGLLLADGTQVAFAPQPAGRLALKAGDRVEVSGWRTPTAQVVRAAAITAAGSRGGNGATGGASLIDVPAPGREGPPPAPRDASAQPALVAMNTSGTVARLLYTDRGDVNGALLSNGTVVRFPPHVGAALQDGLQPGRPLFARGWGSRTAAGNAIEANAMGASADGMRDVLAADGPRRPPAPAGADAPRGPRGAREPGAAARDGGAPRPPRDAGHPAVLPQADMAPPPPVAPAS